MAKATKLKTLLGIAQLVQEDYQQKLNILQQEYIERANLLAELIEAEVAKIQE